MAEALLSFYDERIIFRMRCVIVKVDGSKLGEGPEQLVIGYLLAAYHPSSAVSIIRVAYFSCQLVDRSQSQSEILIGQLIYVGCIHRISRHKMP